MIFAINSEGKRITASSKGIRAKCECCNSAVISKCGSLKINHFAHESLKDCDPWYEPITQWHLSWQKIFLNNTGRLLLKDLEEHTVQILLFETNRNY